ncbi:DUF973 family protein [Saccharolobus caldissimus]|uniref:DUF973 family protein n=1 Tax=Saccharolobus caldissimus TaxID=1702097 RepID=A0AAQ4CQT9_9CREN|nr:DUF973 family protein [Saccharolobus caldissimus]BDB98170.1 hypothetical protein SACC_11870 [Saccharolobus caldissimus]
MSQQEYKGIIGLRRGLLDIIIIILVGLITYALIYVMEYLTLPLIIIKLIIISASILSALLLIIAYLDVKGGFEFLRKSEINIKMATISSPLLLTLSIILFIEIVVYSLITVNIFTSLSEGIYPYIYTLLRIVAFSTLIVLAFSYRKLGEHYNSDLINYGSLIFILGVLTFIFHFKYGGFLALIGIITMYVGISDILKEKFPRFKSSNVSLGVLRNNGEAELSVYSKNQIQVISATILGTNYISNTITPNVLTKGYNSLKINFNSPIQLTPKNIYTIRLSLSNGRTLDVNVIYETT